MNNFRKSAFFAFACSFSAISGNAVAQNGASLGNQWYFGLGGGTSQLQPDPRQDGIDIDRRLGSGGNLFFGLDIDDRTSGQLTLYGLGDAELDNNELVSYQALDGSVLFRFYDTNDARVRRSSMHLALYGRFALGFLNRDTDLQLVNDSSVYFGAGGGAEWFINNTLSVRLEGIYLDKDAAYGSLQLVGRFGSRRGSLSRSRPIPIPSDASTQPPTAPPTTPPITAEPSSPPASVPSAPTESVAPTKPNEQADQSGQVESVELLRPVEQIKPIEPAEQISLEELVEQAELTELIEPIEPAEPIDTDSNASTQSGSADQDGDNVPDAKDQCPGSRAGYPVRSTGCALFDGVLSGVSFVEGSSALLPDAADKLEFLASVLVQHPNAKVELHVHTDNSTTVTKQTALTRARVRTIGAYLVRQGVAVDRLILRSFGASRPLYDNENEQGRIGNNRVEVIESTE